MRASLLVYGSLLGRDERLRAGLEPRRAFPARVSGFQRAFSQAATWRKGSGRRRAVLTARAEADAAFNGVVATGLSTAALADLDERERGYHRVEVTWGQVVCATSRPRSESLFLYVGRAEHHRPDLEPHPAYLSLCLRGAAEWGPRFLEAFLETTDVRTASLRRYPGLKLQNNYNRAIPDALSFSWPEP